MHIQKITYTTGANPSVQNSIRRNQTQNLPAFTGFGLFKPRKNPLNYAKYDSDVRIYSPQELKNLKRNVAYEISEMLDSPAVPAQLNRMKELLNSPFVDYETRYIDNTFSLADKITFPPQTSKNTDSYRQFVTTSLSETMPFDILTDTQKSTLTKDNITFKKILYDYQKMDESTPQAASVRKMIKRLGENNIPVHNKDYHLAMSLIHEKPLMSKTIIDTFNITPDKDFLIVTPAKHWFDETVEKMFNPKILRDKIYNYDFCVLDTDKVDRVYADGSMTFYNLAGLSENKEIREIFDAAQYLKDFYSKTYGMNLRFEKFIRESQDYHPELLKLDFIEKYLKKFGKTDKDNISMELRLYPEISRNTELVKSIDSKLEILKRDNTDNSAKDIELLTNLREYITS